MSELVRLLGDGPLDLLSALARAVIAEAGPSCRVELVGDLPLARSLRQLPAADVADLGFALGPIDPTATLPAGVEHVAWFVDGDGLGLVGPGAPAGGAAPAVVVSAAPAVVGELRRRGVEAHLLPLAWWVEPAGAESIARVRADLGVAPAQRLVLGAGPEPWAAGADLFVDVARRLRHLDGVRFAWIGPRPGSRARILDHDIEASGLGDRLVSTEPSVPLDRYLAAADVVALTRRDDGAAGSALAAGIAGRPAVGFAFGTQAALATEGGMLVAPFPDVAGLAALVERLLTAPGDGAALADRARRFGDEHHSPAAAGRALVARLRAAASDDREPVR